MTVAEALFLGKQQLKAEGMESYALDTTLLLMEATSLTKTEVYTKSQQVLSEGEETVFLAALAERKQKKPIQYILGKCEFMALPFAVREGVLIPRPDTEVLVETVLEYAKKEGLTRALDICTGTGCIAISLAKYGGFSVCGIDISDIALAVAEQNGIQNDVSVTWAKSDLFQTLPQRWQSPVDCIISNPPYIATEEVQKLMADVKEFEPHLALDGGADGLHFYRSIIAESKQHLKAGGWLFFEIGYDQGQAVSSLLERAGFTNIELRQDLAGLDRVVLGKAPL